MNISPTLWFDDYIHIDGDASARYFLPPDRWLTPRSGRGLLISYMVVGVGPACSGNAPTLVFAQSAMPTDYRGTATPSPFAALHTALPVAAGTEYNTLSFGAGGTGPSAAPLGYVGFSLAANPLATLGEWAAVRLRVFVVEAD